ncbi:MAG: hypothetical protein L3J10_05120 [Sulfurimonas sp.]|nr:hypothetical protein [Sulfurimonas sp.]
MWLKETIEKRYLKYLEEFYSRADKRFMLKNGVQTFHSYTNLNQYHLVGYVVKSYNVNGTTFFELRTASNDTLTITAPKYIDAESLEYQSVLCEGVIEHCTGIVDNSIFERTCSKVTLL